MARILVIDDEDEIRMVLRQFLEEAGYEVDEAHDGIEGTRLCREKPADLIIVDMIMPGKEGMETILDFRADFPEVKIIAMSGGGDLGPEPYLQVAEGLGAIRVFTKPFRLEEILGTVRKLVG